MLRSFLLTLAVVATLVSALPGHAQPLQVIGHDSRFGPICAGPLGPGPCADVERYLRMRLQGMGPGALPGPGPFTDPGPFAIRPITPPGPFTDPGPFAPRPPSPIADPGPFANQRPFTPTPSPEMPNPPTLLQVGYVNGVGPICAGPLGPGPCAAVAQYLQALNAAAPRIPAVTQQDLNTVRSVPGVGPVCQTAMGAVPCAQAQQMRLDSFSGALPSQASFGIPQGLSAVDLARRCAQRVGMDATLFAACTGKQVVLPENLQKVMDCAVKSRETEDFAKCSAGHLGMRLSSDQGTAVDCALSSNGDRDDFISCAGEAFLTKNLDEDQGRVLSCAADAAGDAQTFRQCAARALNNHLSADQSLAVKCAVESKGDQDDFMTCAGSALLDTRLNRDQRQVLSCAQRADGDSNKFVGCAATSLLGNNASREQQVALRCAAESQGEADSMAMCVGLNMFNLQLNPEQQIAVQCVASTGGEPYSAAGCMASRLTARELMKCAANGIGGPNGCFGDNNDLVGKNGWVARNFPQILAGPFSLVTQVDRVWGGDNSFLRNPGQIWGGGNSFVRNPSQVWGGPNSVFNNPGQLLPAPKPVTLGSVGGKRICIPWC